MSADLTRPDRECVDALLVRAQEVLLEWRPAVGLFCYEHNAAARRVYERVGFRSLFYYRSWLLDEPLLSDPRARR